MNRRGFLEGIFGAAVAIAAVPLSKLLPLSRTARARKIGPSAAELEFWRNRPRAALGYNFYDLEASVQPLYPICTYKDLGIERAMR